MKEIIIPTADFAAKGNQDVSAAGKKRGRWILALYFCGIGGISAGLTGLFISGLAFFGFIENTQMINRIGTWLAVAAFPLAMFGAHAMDKIIEIDRNKKRKAFEAEQKQELYSPEQWRKNDFAQL